ncbi:hypothetical protein ACJX0J_018830 [Zea mays]
MRFSSEVESTKVTQKMEFHQHLDFFKIVTNKIYIGNISKLEKMPSFLFFRKKNEYQANQILQFIWINRTRLIGNADIKLGLKIYLFILFGVLWKFTRLIWY